jgi:hypothetical protein
MKLRFDNRQTVDTWFDRVTKYSPINPCLNVYGSNLRAHGHTLYSYGTHFPLARWYPEQRIFLINTSERRSNSTSRHQNYVRRSCPENYIEVGELIRWSCDPVKVPDAYIAAFNTDILNCVAQHKRSRKYKVVCMSILNAAIQRRNKFIQTFGGKAKAIELPEDVTAALVTLKLAA